MTRVPATGVLRFAALGDSVTVGIGDPMPDGGWRGWAALLAPALAAPDRVELHNLAVSGARTRDVAGPQLAAALRLRPQVSSVIMGVNDTLRNSFDLPAIGSALTGCVAALSARGSLVMTARLPEPGRMLGLPAALARSLARRIHAVNALTDCIAARFGTVHVDVAAHPGVYDPRMWSVDRLHPSERGHRLLASCFAEALDAAGFPLAGRPALQPDNPEPTRRAQAWWMATRGTGWVLRRGGDLLPGLVGMAAAEWWYGRRGAANILDDGLGREVAAALNRAGDSVVA